MTHLFQCLLLTGCISTAVQAAPHVGHVFIDANNNGIFDKGDKALPNIAVSDGLHVVKTASDGSFTLQGHERERFIFITTPSGYKTNNQHYHPILSETTSYDFALQPYNGGIRKDGSHKYIHISDTEIFNTENHGDWVNNARDYAANEQASFIIHTGDICYEKGLQSHIKLMNTENMNCPVFYCIGNHDLVKGKYGEELFESIYGPVYYSFDAGSVHYIVTPMLGGDHAPGYTKADVYHWMKNDLAQVPAGKPIMIFNHDLLTNDDTFIYGISDSEQINLNEHNLKAWIYGHWHINFIKKQGDVYAVSTATLDKGGIDHSTSAFRVMHVDKKGDFTSELRYTYLDKQIRITAPSDGQAPAILANGQVPLVINTYNTTAPVKEVVYNCTVDNKPLFSNKKLQQATDWSWQTNIPLTAKQTGKEIQIQVKTVFQNGQTAEAQSTFIYQATRPEVRLTTDWKNLLGNPAHTAETSSTLNPPLQMAWISNVGANIYMTSPILYKGNVYTASVDEDLQGEAHVYALNGQSGDILWKYPVRNSIKNTIAIDDECVFAQDAEGYLYALDVETGKLRWEKKLSISGLPSLIDGLVAANGVVYAGTGKGLCAINCKNGTTLWQNTGWDQGEGTTSTLALGNDVLIGSAQWKGLYANQASTGKFLWEKNENGLRNRGASAAIHGNLIYIISNKSFFILDASTGQVIVRKDMPFNLDVTSTPLLTDQEIIFGSAQDGLIALDRETLETKWQFKTDDALVYTVPYSRKASSTIETSPVLAGNTIYVAASDGSIYGISKETGKQVWKHTTGAPIFNSVAVSGNTLVTSDFGGNVYAFTLKD